MKREGKIIICEVLLVVILVLITFLVAFSFNGCAKRKYAGMWKIETWGWSRGFVLEEDGDAIYFGGDAYEDSIESAVVCYFSRWEVSDRGVDLVLDKEILENYYFVAWWIGMSDKEIGWSTRDNGDKVFELIAVDDTLTGTIALILEDGEALVKSEISSLQPPQKS